MKFTCQKNELAGAISIVSKALSSKPQMPILSGIYLRATDHQIEIEATDFELGIIVAIDAEIAQPGQMTLPGRYFQAVIHKLPGDTVSIDEDSEAKSVRIQSDAANYTLRTMNASEYPCIHRLEGDLHVTIKDNILRSLVKKAAFACSNDESRPIFTGVYMDIDQNTLTMAATNTHRLAVKKETFDAPIGAIKLIIPAKVLTELQHILTSEIPSDVEVTCSLNQVSFAFENIYMTSRLIEGAFPNYRNVIPQNLTVKVEAKTSELSAAMDRVSLISRANDYNVVKLDFHDSELHISSSNPDIGHAEETIPVAIEGDAIQIAFNATYLVDVLKALDGETCTISLHQPLSPITITEPDDPDFIYVATPVRTAQ